MHICVQRRLKPSEDKIDRIYKMFGYHTHFLMIVDYIRIHAVAYIIITLDNEKSTFLKKL